jgi:hypothetical protein
MTFDLEAAQAEALRQLNSASWEVKMTAGSILKDMERIVACIDDGVHLPSFSNQSPFDLRDKYSKREVAVSNCHRLHVPGEDIVKASKGLSH